MIKILRFALFRLFEQPSIVTAVWLFVCLARLSVRLSLCDGRLARLSVRLFGSSLSIVTAVWLFVDTVLLTAVLARDGRQNSHYPRQPKMNFCPLGPSSAYNAARQIGR
jgi:hypothetical protein